MILFSSYFVAFQSALKHFELYEMCYSKCIYGFNKLASKNGKSKIVKQPIKSKSYFWINKPHT